MKLRIAFVFTLIILAPITVASQNHPTAAQHERQSQEANPTVTVSTDTSTTNYAESSKDKPQGWHKFVTWPEGIATWALIFTLAAIVYQAVVTHLSVKIAKDALIASQRPKLEVKHVALIPGRLINAADGAKTLQDDRQWRISCVIANVGASKAHITHSDLTIFRLGIGTLDGLLPPVPPYGGKYSFGSFIIESGERREEIVALDANEESMSLRVSYQAAKSQGRHTGTAPLICFGFFRYRDESGVSRLTGFGWAWNAYDMSFSRIDNPDYNYTD